MKRRFALLSLVLFVACASEPESRPPEFNAWTGPDGLRTNAVTEGWGPAHCGWHTTAFLHYQDQTYVRDLDEIFEPDSLDRPYEYESDLPREATRTDFKSDGRQLWIVPGEDGAVYIRYSGHTELWPALLGACY
jgi:hypothetical protein